MKKIIFYFLPLFLLIIINQSAYAAEKTKVYSVEIRYKDGAVTIGNITVKDGYPTVFNEGSLSDDDVYKIELRSFTDEILEQIKFNISTTLMPPPPLMGDPISASAPVVLKETSVLINLLYHRDGKSLVLYGSDNVRSDLAEISYLADACGDNICQPHESFESCSKDCPAAGKDDYCNPALEMTDPDCLKTEPAATTTPAAEKKSPSDAYVLYAVGGSVVILIIIGSVLFFKKRKTDGVSTEENRFNNDK